VPAVPVSEQSTMPRFPFPGDSACQFPPELRRLLDEPTMTKVVLPTGHPAWLAVRYDDVRTVSADPRFSRAETTQPGSPSVGPISLAQSPGAHLARVELQVAVGALLRRFPNLRLAVPAADLPWKHGMSQRGLAELPVAW